MDLGLKGKVAAITGGSEGHRQGGGDPAGAGGESVGDLRTAPGRLQVAADEIAKHGNVLAVADVMKPADCERFIAETAARYGRLDIRQQCRHVQRECVQSVTDEVGSRPDRNYSARCAARAIPHMNAGRRAHHQHHDGGRRTAGGAFAADDGERGGHRARRR
jgi:hypothetical protein